MSQFVVVWGKKPELDAKLGLRLVPVSEAQEYVKRATDEMLTVAERSAAWQVVDGTGDTASDLFETGCLLSPDERFETTELARALCVLAESSVALWGAGGWSDLEEFTETPNFLAAVQREVADGAEVYAVLRRIGHEQGAG